MPIRERESLTIIGSASSEGTARVETSWQTRLSKAARTVDDLHRRGLVKQAEIESLRAAEGQHKVFVSDYYLNLIDKDDPAAQSGLRQFRAHRNSTILSLPGAIPSVMMFIA